MSKFKVGDKVSFNSNHPYSNKVKDFGTIISAYERGNKGKRGVVNVKVDGYCTLGFEENEIKLVPPAQKILITTDGATVTASYENGSEASSASVELGRYAGFPQAAQAALMRVAGMNPVWVKIPDANSAKHQCKVGARVTVAYRSQDGVGTIIGHDAADKGGNEWLVEFDKPNIGCHNGGGYELDEGRYGTSNNCLWYSTDELTVIAEPKPAEKPQDKPAEPVKLYCVKSCLPGALITKGKVYEFDGRVSFDEGKHISSKYASFEDFTRLNVTLSSRLVPLVKRPAKVGEWVYIVDASPIGDQSYNNGDIFQITHMHDFWTRNVCTSKLADWLEDDEYLVLDGYKG